MSAEKDRAPLATVLSQAAVPAGAVFLSYASEDAQAAERIATALRVAGIEVWFDKSELRGGDAWDLSIRKQIKACALFIPVVSRHTHERAEGYFRLEWKLAVDRSHLIMANKAFLLPVVIDDTGDEDEHVPEKFREVQWTRLPDGEAPPAFVERVKRLLSPEVSTAIRSAAGVGALSVGSYAPKYWWSKRVWLPLAVTLVILAAVASVAIDKLWISKRTATLPSAARADFAPPPHSIAVLPFLNMSGDKNQDYFSEGLTEELLNSLSRINQLQVAARTSSFSFQGEHPDIATVAHKLNVASILEGSVRRSGHTIRVTAQLNDAVSGFHLWSETYDRDLGDILQLQTEIANAVASALKVTLLGDIAAKVELGGTSNPAAFDAYLRGRKADNSAQDAKGLQAAIAAYTEAIRQDPHYAFAFALRSVAFSNMGNLFASSDAQRREAFDRAQSDARKAIELAPDLGEGHLALGFLFETGFLDFVQAAAEYERALALAPGNAWVLRVYSFMACSMGRADAAIAAARRAVVLDPLNAASLHALGTVFFFTHHYEQALTAYRDVLTLDQNDSETYGHRGLAYYALGDLQSARASCETKRDDSMSQVCLSATYDKLGRHADAEAMRAKLQAANGEASAYQYAEIYAQWGDTSKALEWLETALRLRDPGLEEIKTDPLLDPLHQQPRFQAVVRGLKFPD